jgi:cobalamin biosynthesis protein CbiD
MERSMKRCATKAAAAAAAAAAALIRDHQISLHSVIKAIKTAGCGCSGSIAIVKELLQSSSSSIDMRSTDQPVHGHYDSRLRVQR